MGNLWSQATSLMCPQCGDIFEVEMWLIVDVVERPDLLDRIRNVTLHDLTCSMCNQTTVHQSVCSGYVDVHPYAGPYHWAGFVYCGAL